MATTEGLAGLAEELIKSEKETTDAEAAQSRAQVAIDALATAEKDLEDAKTALETYETSDTVRDPCECVWA